MFRTSLNFITITINVIAFSFSPRLLQFMIYDSGLIKFCLLSSQHFVQYFDFKTLHNLSTTQFPAR